VLRYRTALIVLCLLVWPAASSADVLVTPSGPTFASVGEEAVVFNGYAYFAADNGVVGNELWRTNGTTTELVKDFNTGGANDDGSPGGFRVAGNRLFFNVTNNDASPFEGTSVVYYIDSSAPTTPVKTFIPGAVVANGNLIGAVNGKVLLQQQENGNGNHGLYALGGSGTTFADIDPGTANVSSEPAATMGGYAYLTINPGGANGGSELYRTDGSSVARVKDINTAGAAAGSSPFDFVATGNRVYFEANDGVNGTELWVTDGSDPGTQMVKNHTTGSGSTSITAESVANGNTLFYVPNDPATGTEPWRTDGTPAGTALVKDVTPGPTGSGFPVLAPFGSGFVTALKGDVYTSDGTDAGTVLVADPDADGMGARLLGAANSRYYFRGGFSPFGGALWRTDGTVAGTGALTVGEFTLGATGSFDAGLFTSLGSKAIFFGYFPGGVAQRRMYVLETAQPDSVRQVTTAPSISGTPAVGQQLTGNPGAWTLEPFNEYAFQWLRNGVPIPGTNATSSAYKPVAADNGTQLSLRVTATGIGLPNEVTAASAPVTVGAAAAPPAPPPPGPLALTVRTKPKLTGTARVGKRLKVTLPTFAQSGVALKFRWFANGKRITGQAKSSLKLKKAQKGKRITVEVSATKAGYKTLELKAGPTKKVKRKQR
jgi:ELWxxDGT repeat protein